MPDSTSKIDSLALRPRTLSSGEVGRILGNRYRLVAQIGAGASAQVFLADDLSLGRRVAVKCLRSGLSDDARFVKRFRAEATAAAQLSHPNLLAVYDWDESPSSAYIVTEVLLGGSLLDLIDRQPLSPSQGLLVALQVAQGLKYAHAIGWVHRDIKPANLLFGQEGRLRIADFGIARAVAEAAWTEPEGVLVGTARYAAPEQAEGDAIDGKADIYSLALTIVEAVTGRVPLLGENALSTMVLRQDRDVDGFEELGALGTALARAGRADPRARPTAAQLIENLTRTARSLPRPQRLALSSGPARFTHPTGEPDGTIDLRDKPDTDTGRPGSDSGGRPGGASYGEVGGHQLRPGDAIKSRPIRRPSDDRVVQGRTTPRPRFAGHRATPVGPADHAAVESAMVDGSSAGQRVDNRPDADLTRSTESPEPPSHDDRLNEADIAEESTQTESAPAESAPTASAPAESAPTESAPTASARPQSAPVEIVVDAPPVEFVVDAEARPTAATEAATEITVEATSEAEAVIENEVEVSTESVAKSPADGEVIDGEMAEGEAAPPVVEEVIEPDERDAAAPAVTGSDVRILELPDSAPFNPWQRRPARVSPDDQQATAKPETAEPLAAPPTSSWLDQSKLDPSEPNELEAEAEASEHPGLDPVPDITDLTEVVDLADVVDGDSSQPLSQEEQPTTELRVDLTDSGQGADSGVTPPPAAPGALLGTTFFTDTPASTSAQPSVELSTGAAAEQPTARGPRPASSTGAPPPRKPLPVTIPPAVTSWPAPQVPEPGTAEPGTVEPGTAEPGTGERVTGETPTVETSAVESPTVDVTSAVESPTAEVAPPDVAASDVAASDLAPPDGPARTVFDTGTNTTLGTGFESEADGGADAAMSEPASPESGTIPSIFGAARRKPRGVESKESNVSNRSHSSLGVPPETAASMRAEVNHLRSRRRGRRQEPPRPVRLTRLFDEDAAAVPVSAKGLGIADGEPVRATRLETADPSGAAAASAPTSNSPSPTDTGPPKAGNATAAGVSMVRLDAGPTPDRGSTTAPVLGRSLERPQQPETAGAEEPSALLSAGAAAPGATVVTSTHGPSRRRPQWLAMAVLICLILVMIGAVAAIAVRSESGTEAGSSNSTVLTSSALAGDYVGGAPSSAEADAERYNWLLSVTEERRTGTEAGEVIEQEPSAGASLGDGDRLNIVVSLGPELRTVPSVVGKTVDEATVILDRAELDVGDVIEIEGDDEEGLVLGLEVDGVEPEARLEADTAVDLIVSAGPSASPMPSFVGLTVSQSIAQANDLGLELRQEQTFSERYDEGFVAHTEPPTDTPVEPGDTVTILVSRGAPFVTIPDVVGKSADEAAAELSAAGFEIAATTGPSDQPVVATDPASGEAHRKGRAVTIITGP